MGRFSVKGAIYILGAACENFNNPVKNLTIWVQGINSIIPYAGENVKGFFEKSGIGFLDDLGLSSINCLLIVQGNQGN